MSIVYCAAVAELVDAQDLKSCTFGCESSSLSRGTIYDRHVRLRQVRMETQFINQLDIMEKTFKKIAKDIMTKEVITVKEDENIKQLFKLMDEGGILGVPVVDEKRRVIGIITESDLIKHFTTLKAPRSINLLGGIIYLDDISEFNEQLKEHCAEIVKDLMFEPAITVKEDATLLDVINIMSENQITRLPVVDKKDQLVGIITRTDIVHQLAKVKKV